MESSSWTNERLDDLSRRVDHGFERVDQRFASVDQRFAEVGQEIRDLRGEMRADFRALNALVLRIGGGIIVALIGVIAAILAAGG